MAVGLIGRKLGMTQIFNQEGLCVGCTVVQVGPCTVLQKKTTESRDGYGALKLAFDPVPERKLTRPMRGVFAKRGLPTHRTVGEFRASAEELQRFEQGQVLASADLFQPGDYVDVTGTSKGRGFTGVVKRFGFTGASKMTHGTHEYFRHPGSAGPSATPAHTLKGTRRPGQMGATRVTVQNLLIVRAHPDQGLLIIRGAVPGPTGSLVTVRPAVKLHHSA